ncbi:MAG TPA: hypothetical protein VGG28_21770 [Kofleriaceae bacterium]
MSSWVAAIVDTRGRSDFWDVARSQRVSASADTVPVRALIECAGDFDASTRLAEALSAELETSAVGLLMQTGADVHGVRAFDRGKLVRRIDYSRDSGGWLVVSGAPQPWESVFFFDGPADLARGTPWPDTISDDLSDADIARYETARAIGDASNVMDLVHASGGSIHRVAAALGVDPSQPAGRYRRPRWWQRALGR